MNALDKLFNEKKSDLLAIYFTAGFPLRNSLTEIISALNETETDIIEIGIPFSDPMADGEVIQHSSKIALANGMNINLLFEQIGEIKNQNAIPLVIMTYFNPVYKFGFEKFCQLCAANSISGLIIPDLPLIEYENNYKRYFEKYDLRFTPLVSPTTSEKRIQSLCKSATGFIYMVSNNSITGNHLHERNNYDMHNYANVIRKYANEKPVLLGFGINSSEKYNQACETVNGGIIGSAFIQILEQNKNNITQVTKEFVSIIKSKVYDHSIAK